MDGCIDGGSYAPKAETNGETLALASLILSSFAFGSLSFQVFLSVSLICSHDFNLLVAFS